MDGELSPVISGHDFEGRAKAPPISLNQTGKVQHSRRILVVDDDVDIQVLLKTNLEYEGFHVDVVGSLYELENQIKNHQYDAVLLDVFLGDHNSLDVLPELVPKLTDSKIIVMTGNGSVDLAVEAMKKGANNFLIKSSDPQKISEELKATIYSQYGIAALSDEPLPENLGIVGKSARLRQVITSINQMKDVDSTVLIVGESGTGKELVARALHRLSNRSEGPFRAINCGAIPENLLESELFGHKKSAFTDAKTDRKGIFEVCSGGTLLLDEIGDMPYPLQVKLLRVLQEKEVTPVGSSDSIKINTRVIASTHQDLERQVRENEFREDLYYRLSVLSLELPSLRERREDIPVLVQEFIQRFNQRFSKSINYPGHEVMARLQSYDWPGNVRELQNVIERGVVLANAGNLRLVDLFPKSNRPSIHAERVDVRSVSQSVNEKIVPFDLAKQEFEKNYLIKLLEATEGNISEASRLAGQYRTKIYRLLKRYNIDVGTFKYSRRTH